jgi:hypothetical protein
MWILYLDESGTHGDAAHLVVGGVAVFERSTHWLKREVEEALASALGPNPAVEPCALCLHASRLHVGGDDKVEAPYDRLSPVQRRAVLDRVYATLAASKHGVFFATVVDKDYCGTRDPYEVAFEDLISRFDLFLVRRHTQQGDSQRGMVVVAESNYRERIESLGSRILAAGTQWSRTKNLAEIPLFTPARNSRLLQLSDLVSNAVFGSYEKGLARHFNLLLPRFDREGDRLHGLTHLSADAATCMCQACLSWRLHRG